MKNTCKRMLACLLATMMLVGATACTGGNGPADTNPAGTDGSTQTTAPGSDATTPESETEGETIYKPEDYEVTVEGDSAQVITPMGLAYTVTGYSSLDKATATFTEGLTYTFDETLFDERFTRFTLTYASSEPVKIRLSYTERGKKVEDSFFLEAGKTEFSGLNSYFLQGNTARTITTLRVEPLTDKTATFTLTGLVTERMEKPGSTCYIENSRFKLGVDIGWGGAVSYLEDKSCQIPDLGNLVNRHDTGRLIQQSFYGTGPIPGVYEPGISFDTQWNYNPVQGGDQYNNASRLIDLVITENSIYIKAQPQDWSLDNQLTPSYMENTYTLYDDRVQVDNRFTDYSGWEHPFRGQELPAFYTVSYLDTFVWYNGEDSWTGDTLSSKNDLPFWGDYAGQCTFTLREKNTETWCAWINGSDDYGLGVYAPNIDQLKAGRYMFDGSKSDMAESTGYVAPVNILKMVSFEPIEYSYLLTAGSTAEIRKTFTTHKDFTNNEGLHKNYQSSRLPSVDGDITKLDFSGGKNLTMLTNPNDTTILYDELEGAVKLTAGSLGDVNVTIPYGSSPTPLSASDYTTLKIEYRIPADNSTTSYQSDIFICAGDITGPDGNARLRVNLIANGEYHTLEVKLSGNAYWKGNINLIRFDYFDFSAAGDVMYIKSINLE